MNELEIEKPNDELVKKRNPLIKVYTTFGVSIFVCLSISITMFFILKNEINKAQSEIENTKKEIEKRDQLLASLENKMSGFKLDETKAQMTYFDERMFMFDFQHTIEGGVVTDELIVEKATLYNLPKIKDEDKDRISGTIDIDTQPTFSSKYIGQGRFTLTDRELKNAIKDLMNEVGDRYGIQTKFRKNIPNWTDSEIVITIKNYEIGTYKNGELILKGE